MQSIQVLRFGYSNVELWATYLKRFVSSMSKNVFIIRKLDPNLFTPFSNASKKVRAGAFLEPCKTSKMEVFAKIVNGFQPQWFYRVVNMPEKTSHWLSLYSVHKKCPHSELFWSAFSRIRTEYGQIRSNENADRITPNTDTFPVVISWCISRCCEKNSPRFLLL